MMTLITGLPGRGKTLYAVQLIREASISGRKIYSDVEGLKVPHEPIPEGFDWRDTPPGSLIVYDEAHRRFPSSGRSGPSPDEQVNRLDTHRHTGHDFLFITQYPGKLHKVIRDLIDRHVHLVRAFGLQGALMHEWGFCQASPESPTARKEAEKIRWKYPRNLYKLYQSASTHARYNKFELPGRAWLLPVGGLALGLLIWQAVGSWSARMSSSDGDAAELAIDAPLSMGIASAALPAVVDAGVGIRGCITRGQSCRCVTGDGVPVAVDPWDCIVWSADPFAVRPEPYAYAPPPPYVPPLGVISASTGSAEGSGLSGGSGG